MADVGCRNTIFGAQAQTDPIAIESWRAAGISNFRLEFVHQTATQVTTITTAFANFFSSELSAVELKEILAKTSPQNISEGSLYVPEGFKNLVQLS